MSLASQLLRYFLLGTVLYAASLATAIWPPPWRRGETIHIADADVQSLRNTWSRETGRMPTAAEQAASLRKLADDETLFREALRIGLDRADPVVRARLIQNLRFTDPGTKQSDDELLREALALGMARHDTVVRRRLVQAMEQRIAASTRLSDAELRAYVAAHPERYAELARLQFSQVYLSADAHRARLDADARALGEKLGALAADAPEAPALGDAFMLGRSFGPSTQEEIAQRFGQPFAAAVFAAPRDLWTGPIASAYGLQFVRVIAREPAHTADYSSVRRQAYYALLEEREHDSVATALRGLREHYPVIIDPPVAATTVSALP